MQKWIKYEGVLYNLTLATEIFIDESEDSGIFSIELDYISKWVILLSSSNEETVNQAFIRIQNFLDHDSKVLLEL